MRSPKKTLSGILHLFHAPRNNTCKYHTCQQISSRPSDS
jgi:hypothetical protein